MNFLQQKAQKILADLVAFPVLGGDSNLGILEYIKNYLSQLEVSYHLVENEDASKASIHCRIGPAVDNGIILSGHMDVVPVEGQAWKTDPFELIEHEDNLYARGAADMKGFLACCLACVPHMQEATLKSPIYLAFSYDEEIGCLAGPDLIKDIKKVYKETPKYAIVGEPNLLQPSIGHKGITFLRTRIKGSAGHSSRIKAEVSAVHEAARLISWLEGKMDALIQAGHLDNRFTPNHSSIHIGKIQGGIATNIIADFCYFDWDIRVIPQDDINQILKEFEAYCQKREQQLRAIFKGAKITTTLEHPIVPTMDTPEHFSVVPLIQKLTGQKSLNTVAFACEGGQYAEGGFETVICGPGSIDQAHRANEYISKEQLGKGVEFIQKIIQEFS